MMHRREYPPQDMLLQKFAYDPNTGVITRNFAGGGKQAGTRAEHTRGRYLSVKWGGEAWYAHRIAFILHYGDVLSIYDDVDHDDGNGFNNVIENLFQKTHAENCRNNKIPSNNKSGYPGVIFDNQHTVFKAYITVDYKQMKLGEYHSFDAALEARLIAEQQFNFKTRS